MMHNYKIILQYEGTRYQGWQKQTSTDNTIQGKLEKLLGKMCGCQSIEVQGAGRTDAGVHALGQTANFHVDTDKSLREIMQYMNEYLPDDIAVVQIEQVDDRFHSRLNAIGKTYRYRVLNSEIPHVFDRKMVYEYPVELDVEKMKEAAKLFVGKHDFCAFTSNKKTKKSTVRTISKIVIERMEDEIVFTYEGDGFLYHMVRIITGTLLEIGEGKRSKETIEELLTGGMREEAGFLVPGKGLTLCSVTY